MSLFTTISGITNSQSMLDVIGDNIANINTVGFKSSTINFQSIFSNTLSAGSGPTATSGGINPEQVGLGVTVSEISRNFERGAIQTTGKNTDLNIQGDGFFTLKDSDNKMLLTRAGNFSVDSAGNLVNPDGLKVTGTDSTTSLASGTATVQIPTSLVINESNVVTDKVTNNAITDGTFTLAVNGGTPASITIASTDTMQNIVNKMNSTMSIASSSNTAALNSAGQIVISGHDNIALANGTSNFTTIAATTSSNSYTSSSLAIPPAVVVGGDVGDFTMSINGGAASTITVGGTDTYADLVTSINTALGTAGSTSIASLNSSHQVVISGPDTLAFTAGTSAFPTTAGFLHDETSTTKALSDNPKVDITASDPTSANNYKATSYTIGSDGAIDVSYSNGSSITVTGTPVRGLKYTSSTSNEIDGNNVTQSAGAVIDPAQLQIQLAQVINPKGLESVGGNMFSINANAGTPSFAIGNSGGLGAINSGSLEASNVDLPTEFANMIIAQKAIEANSRAFSVENQIMDTIVNLGR